VEIHQTVLLVDDKRSLPVQFSTLFDSTGTGALS
jgi:hypothetical protein